MANDIEEDGEAAAAPNETKAERFKRVVNPRFRNAVKRLRLLKSMVDGGNYRAYEFTDAQRVALINGLQAEINDIDKLMVRALRNEADQTDDLPEI